jgi:hypothetical protein
MAEKDSERLGEEPVIQNGELVSEIEGWWDVVTANPTDPENPTVTRAYKHSTKTRPSREEIADMLVRTAPANRVSPTKRKRPTDTFEVLAFYGDTHHPFQDQRKLSLANLVIRETMPTTVVYLGDDLDMANFSRFESRQEWLGSTQMGIDLFSAQLAQTRADIGAEGQIIVHQGNHDVRFERMIRGYNAELMGIRRGNADGELGVLTLDFLLRCEEMGVQYVSGYPTGEYWHSDTLKSYHGSRTNSGGLVAAKEAQSETVNFVHGHTHQAGIVYRTFRQGREQRTIWGMECGTFADFEHVPSGQFAITEGGDRLRQNHNWQSGVGLVYVTPDGEIPHFVPITDEGVLINNKWYKS